MTRVLCRVWRDARREGIARGGVKQRQQASKRGGNGFTRRQARGGAAGYEGGEGGPEKLAAGERAGHRGVRAHAQDDAVDVVVSDVVREGTAGMGQALSK